MHYRLSQAELYVRQSITTYALLMAISIGLGGHTAHATVTTTGATNPSVNGVDLWDLGPLELLIGFLGAGTLNIEDGGRVDSGFGHLGFFDRDSGIATITGTNSQWNISEDLNVGFLGTGTLNIQAGGVVSNTGDGIIGDGIGSSGTATVTGNGSQWNNNDFFLFVGNSGTGTLNIEDGGGVSNVSSGLIGTDVGSSGTATVTGVGSQWTNFTLTVGNFGMGTLNIEAGGRVSTELGAIGRHSGSSGMATITGTESQWNNNDFSLFVGFNGTGTLSIEDGGLVSNASDGVIGTFSGSSGTAIVTGAESQWNNDGSLTVGSSGTGTLNVENRGGVSSEGSSAIGENPGSVGTVTVTGVGSQWNNVVDSLSSGLILSVGYHGTGTLNIEDGGVVNNNLGNLGGVGGIGVNAGAVGTVTVTGVGSQWNNIVLSVGGAGTGTLNVEEGGRVSNESGSISATGTATVTGMGSQWNNNGDLTVGGGGTGTGTLNIEDRGVVNNDVGIISGFDGSSGMVTVTGDGSQWNNNGGSLFVGLEGMGTLDVEDRGVVNSNFGFIGGFSDSIGTATVIGTGSQWNNTLDLIVGFEGAGTLNIENGGVVSNDAGVIGSSVDATGTATVTGAGSQWNNFNLTVGDSGTGTLNIKGGGRVSSADSSIGNQSGSSGAVTVMGAGSNWTEEGTLIVGNHGTGTLDIQAGGVVVNGFGIIGGNGGSSGTAIVTGAESVWNNADGLEVGNRGTGTLNHLDGTVQVAHNLMLARFEGSQGDYNLSGGTLDLMDGTLSAGFGTAAFNFTGGTLKNAATINLGQAFVQSGGTLAPGSSPGTTTIVGGYTLGSSGTLAIELSGTAQGTGFDFVDVVGDLDLAGTLDVSLIDGFNPFFGDRFDILDWDTLTGTFDSVVLPTLTDGLTWNLDDLYLTGELAVLLLGDADGDGDVDITDLGILSENFGILNGATLSDGDFNGDGAVDITDLGLLSENFGNTSPPLTTSIPEPGSLTLLSLGGLRLGRRRRA